MFTNELDAQVVNHVGFPAILTDSDICTFSAAFFSFPESYMSNQL